MGEDDFAAMADLGIETVYLQTSHLGVPDEVVLEQDRLESLIDAAHDGLSVVAWYLPTLTDVDRDLERLLASAELDVDGLAVDIESTVVEDPAERNARLLELSADLRTELPDRVIGAITPSAVHLQVVNPDYWPDFPWAEVADTYDLILPMTYWTIRLPVWRDGYRYVGENIDRIHAATGDPDLPLHVIGGIADEATVEQVQGMLDAIEERTGVIGGGLYDWATSSPEQWAVLSPLRDLNPACGRLVARRRPRADPLHRNRPSRSRRRRGDRAVGGDRVTGRRSPGPAFAVRLDLDGRDLARRLDRPALPVEDARGRVEVGVVADGHPVGGHAVVGDAELDDRPVAAGHDQGHVGVVAADAGAVAVWPCAEAHHDGQGQERDGGGTADDPSSDRRSFPVAHRIHPGLSRLVESVSSRSPTLRTHCWFRAVPRGRAVPGRLRGW